MKKAIISVALCFAALGAAAGGGLSRVGRPAEMKEGTFPNGLHYFIVSNPAEAGFADFALVQPGMDGRIDSQPFLERRGVGYGPKGASYQKSGARVINFPDVPVSVKSDSDSTLLILFDLVWQSPFNQTIIVSGDVDIPSTERALEVMNLSVPALTPFATEGEDAKTEFRTVREPFGEVCRIGAEYRIGLPKKELRGTPVMFVTELLCRQLSGIVENRVRRVFRRSGVPFSLLRSDFEKTLGAPVGSTTFCVGPEDAAKADSLFNGIIRDIEWQGVSPAEYRDSRAAALPEVVKGGLRKGDANSKYVERCIAASLYGLPVSSSETIGAFFRGRVADLDAEHLLFNNFARRLVAQDSLASIEPLPDVKAAALGAPQPGKEKRKLKSSTVEPVSGGSLWTFEGGVKVICKKMDGIKGRFNFAFSLRGGLSMVPDLAPGEAPYVADMLDLANVNEDRPMTLFKADLAREGITLTQKVTMSDFRIEGSAPSEALPKVLEAVHDIAYNRTARTDRFDYWLSCEKVRTRALSDPLPDIRTVLDSLSCPDNPYLMKRNAFRIGEDLQGRAEKFFEGRFSNFADGVIVLAGDLDAEQVQALLEQVLPMFAVSRRFAYRKADSFALRSGRTIMEGEGKPQLHMSFTADEPLTSLSVASLLVSEKILSRFLNERLGALGAYVAVSSSPEVYPDERIRLYIDACPLAKDNLCEGVKPAGPVALASAVRAAVEDFAEAPAGWLAEAKKSVLGDKAVEDSRAGRVIDKVLLRYADGKDFTKNFSAAVGSVSRRDVLETVRMLRTGAQVEYIFDKK